MDPGPNRHPGYVIYISFHSISLEKQKSELYHLHIDQLSVIKAGMRAYVFKLQGYSDNILCMHLFYKWDESCYWISNFCGFVILFQTSCISSWHGISGNRISDVLFIDINIQICHRYCLARVWNMLCFHMVVLFFMINRVLNPL